MDKDPNRVFGDYAKDIYWHGTGDFNAIWMSSIKLLYSLSQGNSHIHRLVSDYLKYREKRKSIWVPADTRLSRNARFIGPLIMGNNIEISKSAQIGPNVVMGNDVKIGKGARIKDSVLLPNARIDEEQAVEGAVVFGREVIPAKRTR